MRMEVWMVLQMEVWLAVSRDLDGHSRHGIEGQCSSSGSTSVMMLVTV